MLVSIGYKDLAEKLKDDGLNVFWFIEEAEDPYTSTPTKRLVFILYKKEPVFEVIGWDMLKECSIIRKLVIIKFDEIRSKNVIENILNEGFGCYLG